jgi:tRNA(fMet)-specific endonuclease VapC
MNGKLLLDTNAVIALLNGDTKLQKACGQAKWIGISIITELEFLSFSKISANDVALFQKFKSRIKVIDLMSSDTTMLNEIIDLRSSYNIKLPDAIVAAAAMSNNADLVTNDSIFNRVSTLTLLKF